MEDYKSGFAFLKQLKAQEPDRKDFFHPLTDFISGKAAKKGIPLGGHFELTPLCNFDCKMCYVHLTREQMHGKDLLTVEQWKGLMREAWEAGMIFATLTGGECLSYPGFRELYLYLRSLGVIINLITNGALIDDDWIHFFQEHKPSEITITLYGGDEDTYERVTGCRKFSVVTENLRKLKETGIHLTVGITPSKYLGEGVLDVIRTVQALDIPYMVNSFLMDPHEETGRSGQVHDADIDTYVRAMQMVNEQLGIETHEIAPELLPPPGGPHHECTNYGLPCKAGSAAFTLEWDGIMRPCGSVRDIGAEPLKIGFRAAWEKIRQECLKWPRIPECEDCPYEAVCYSCPIEKARFAEPGKKPLTLCERTMYLVQRGVTSIPACE